MRPSLYTKLHNEKRPSHSEREWAVLRRWHRLPATWRDMVVEPLRLALHEDYEVRASRAIGYDEDDAPCFCTYDYELRESYSDDDEEFYDVIAYAESLAAWRLRDGRWLIHRRIATGGEEAGAQTFYSFSEAMP